MRQRHPILNYGTSRPRVSLTRRQVRATICTIVMLPFALFALFDVGCGFEHRSTLWPWIDTVQARGYSEASFNKIKIGMTRRQVDALMCKPLSISTATNLGYQPLAAGANLDVGDVQYAYTHDGRCPGDFAWKGRSVYFKDGVVTKIFNGWCDD